MPLIQRKKPTEKPSSPAEDLPDDDDDDSQKKSHRKKSNNGGTDKAKWSCVDSCCWFIGCVCVTWWFLLFLYNAMPASFPQYVTEAITGPLPDPPGVKLKKEGLVAKHPVVFIPGIVTGGLELWEGKHCADGLFRKRLWGGTFGEVYKRPLCWVEHMSLDNETGMDPAGIRIRAVSGLVAADYFAPGYFVWAVLIANLAHIGYEEKNMYMAAYDWRLSFQNTEVRDQTLSRMKSNIELMVSTNGGKKAVIVPHSMGVLYFLHFMKWVEAPAPMGGGGGPDWCAKHIKAVMNIGGPFLGVPKAVAGLFSAEAKDVAVARAIAPGFLQKRTTPFLLRLLNRERERQIEMENHTKERLQDPTMQVPSLNCIDLADHDLHRSVVSLKQACLDSGFFYVINHGINEEFMEDVFEQSKKFFALPLEEKMKVLRNEKHRGYTPVLDEILDPENQVNGDHKEGYYIGIEVPKDDPDYDKPFYGPNPWPDSDVLPQWRETMEKYHQEALRVSKDIGRLLALALDLDANYFDTPEMLGKPIATMRLLHYQGVSDPSQGIYACGAHSDYGMMTLLATDGVMGLQICKDKNAKPQKWEYVPAIKGAYIVNLGDMLERWSNGFFKSTLHRVLGNGQERYSIPFFVEPNHECLVECLPTCKSESNVPKYPAIKCSAYLTQRYKETHAELSIYNQEI